MIPYHSSVHSSPALWLSAPPPRGAFFIRGAAMYHEPLERLEWAAVWGLLWAAGITHAYFWMWLWQHRQTVFWWL